MTDAAALVADLGRRLARAQTVVERGRVVAEDLPRELVYAGISLGVLPAQLLTQTRLGAQAAVLISAPTAAPPTAYSRLSGPGWSPVFRRASVTGSPSSPPPAPV